MAAASDGYGRMRASRADREQVIDTLKAAFAQGRLTKDELDERVARALVPLTYAELATLTDDLPAGLTPVVPLRQDSLAKAGVYVTLVAGLFLIAAISNGNGNPLTLLGSVLFLSPVWLLALVGLLALHARLDRRAAGRLPPGPGPGADGAPGEGHAGTGDDPALPGDHAGPPSAEVRAQEPRRDPPDRSDRNVLTPPVLGPVPGPA
jgi:Domain of unknown function (DUF1707)